MTEGHSLTLLLESLLSASKANDISPREEYRQQMLAIVKEAQNKLYSPQEALFKQIMNYTETAAIRCLRQMGALHKLPIEGAITTSWLAQEIGASEEVLRRLMRILSAAGILSAVSENEFAHTPKSVIYLHSTEVEFWDLCVSEIGPVAQGLPEYLLDHKSDDIFDPCKSPFSWANNAEGKSFHEIMLAHPKRLERFNIAMTTQESSMPVLGMFPFVSIAEEISSESKRVFLVDVAGGRGHSLLQIRSEIERSEKASEVAKRRFVLQDRQEVLDSVPENEIIGVQKMVIDFFDGQKVLNAHLYYLRRILHNWRDAECIAILKGIAAAMARDSRLLICEMLVPEKPFGIDTQVYWMDFCMLSIGGKERTIQEFKILLLSAGLMVQKIWRMTENSQAVIECCLKSDEGHL